MTAPLQDKDDKNAEIEITLYKPEYRQAFKDLNVEWITTYFMLEEADLKALDHPEAYILEKGGYILFALYNRVLVGTCALIKMNEESFELAKMAVSPAAQGLGIGYKIGLAAKEKAKEAGAGRIYLESNTILTPAINLYHKLGFQRIAGVPSPYERCNIQMELFL